MYQIRVISDTSIIFVHCSLELAHFVSTMSPLYDKNVASSVPIYFLSILFQSLDYQYYLNKNQLDVSFLSRVNDNWNHHVFILFIFMFYCYFVFWIYLIFQGLINKSEKKNI